MSAQDWAKRFDEGYTPAESPTRQAVLREALGDEYPEGLDANSLVTLSELQRYARDLRVGDGDLLVDAACGRGGPGLWVAAQTGARLVGIDFAPSAIEHARDRADHAGMSDRAEFRVARFEETGLADDAADAIMSIDALIFSEDKPAAFRELHRILRPDARFVFSSWDYSGQVPWRPLMLDDHGPLLEETGFDVLAYDETEDWKGRQTAFSDGVLERVDQIAAELGTDPEESRARIEQMREGMATITRRVFVVAVKRARA
jgi:ubiquinone/menaquinone biosynthesis C-methylase UbiE